MEDAEWEQARQEAAASVQSVLRWNLTPARWDMVGGVLAELTAAAAAPAPAGLWEAAETLDLYMPVRVDTRLGDEPRGPAPRAIREQIAELVDTLQPHGPRGRDGAGLPGGAGQPDEPGQAARRGA